MAGASRVGGAARQGRSCVVAALLLFATALSEAAHGGPDVKAYNLAFGTAAQAAARRLQLLRLGQRRRLHETGPQACTVGGQQGSLDGSQCCGTFQSVEGGRDFMCVAVPSPPPPAPSPPPPFPPPPKPSPPPPKPSPPPPKPSPPPPKLSPPLPHPPLHTEPPRPRPPTGGTRTQSPPPPSPPAKRASGAGDPHFRGFDGSRFSVHPAAGEWATILASQRQGFSLTALMATGPVKGSTFMRAFKLRSGRDFIKAWLEPTGRDRPGRWRIVATANNQPVTGSRRLLSGTTLEFVPGALGVHGRLIVDAGFIRVAIIQRWRPQRGTLADFLDVNVEVKRPLALPVSGILGPSYHRALAKAAKGAGVAAAASVGLPAFLSASGSSA